MKRNPLDLVNEIITIGKERDILHLQSEGSFYDGRIVEIAGKKLIDFGSYSYLGLGVDKRLKEGAKDAIDRYGMQHPSSRAYVSSSLYKLLEKLLAEIFGNQVIICTTTTLAHLAAIPVLVAKEDTVILDQQSHSSLHEAILKMQLSGVKVKIIRHNNLEQLETEIKEAAKYGKRGWYAIDSVYSMYGDCAPLKELEVLMNKYSNFFLYVDDAHGMSWTGKYGVGYALSQIPLHSQMVLVSSLNKAFTAGGAVIVTPDKFSHIKIRNCGAPLIFAGQNHNATLGAAVSCAKIHLTDEIKTLQNELSAKINHCAELLRGYGLPDVSDSNTPIFFVALGLTRVGYNLVRRMIKEGYMVNLAIYPAVSESCTGIRFTITNHLTFADIEKMTASLAHHFHLALAEEGRTMKDIYRAFRRLLKQPQEIQENKNVLAKQNTFSLETYNSIHNIDSLLWNSLMQPLRLDWDYMQFLENAFTNNEQEEHNWKFMYLIVRDELGIPILCTYLTVGLSKDDMLASANISIQVEEERKANPRFLCSKNVMIGSLFSEGQHIYMNRSHSRFQEALTLFLDQLWKLQDQYDADSILIRDLEELDIELRDFFMGAGFVKMDMPDAHYIYGLGESNLTQFLSSFSKKKRYNLKQEVIKNEPLFDIQVHTKPTNKELDAYYQLYRNVKERSFELNTHAFNRALFSHMANHPNWEFISLRLKSDPKEVIAVCVSYVGKDHYDFKLVGLDYRFVKEYGSYKQAIWQVIKRCGSIEKDVLALGMTASITKRKLGGKSCKYVVYVQQRDNYNAKVISAMAEKAPI